jgi:hypothetical protein
MYQALCDRVPKGKDVALSTEVTSLLKYVRLNDEEPSDSV